MKKILIIVLALIVSVFLTILLLNFKNQNSGAIHTIELRKEGFFPDIIKIKKGDTIIFSTTEKNPFWPASNIHPTHGIYSEFDPQDAIMPNKTWSFQFNKAGAWGFHDHLAPYFTGKITVTD